MSTHNHDLHIPQGLYTGTGEEPHPNDVISGRLNESYAHPGNVYFRSLVRKYKAEYFASRNADKPLLAEAIVVSIMNLDPPGRFLKQDKATGQWFDIGYNEAVTKTRQALREGISLLLAAQQVQAQKRRMQEMKLNPITMTSDFSTLNRIGHLIGEAGLRVRSAPFFYLQQSRQPSSILSAQFDMNGRQQMVSPNEIETPMKGLQTSQTIENVHSCDFIPVTVKAEGQNSSETHSCDVKVGKENESTIVTQPHEHDVISGRGNDTISHPGNILFRSLVKRFKVEYVASPKSEKPAFAKTIVDMIQSKSPPGRFLKLDKATGYWNEISYKQALIKTRQALREGAPMIKKRVTEQVQQKSQQQVQQQEERKAREEQRPHRVIDSRTLDAMDALLCLKSAG